MTSSLWLGLFLEFSEFGQLFGPSRTLGVLLTPPYCLTLPPTPSDPGGFLPVPRSLSFSCSLLHPPIMLPAPLPLPASFTSLHTSFPVPPFSMLLPECF